ncbi:MAG: thioesterase family protein [Rhodospirillales bacterium]|nr:thioesterase family protein [Rhodospirillales bacterium]
MVKLPVLHRETVIDDWVDYNGHLNVAYYVLIFDRATDAFLEQVGLDEAYRDSVGGSVFVVESHIVYEREVLLGTEVEVVSQLLNVDNKRLHLFHSMQIAGSRQQAATIEIMILHVDLQSRKSTPFAGEIISRLQTIAAAHAQISPPPHVGRRIGFRNTR